MHLIFGTRGIKKDVDNVVKFLETHPFPMSYKDAKGKKGMVPIQGMLQPIQLWSYVFPEDAKDAVLRSLLKRQWIYPEDAKVRACITGVRKIMGAEKIPDFDLEGTKMFLPPESMKNISIVPIGVKYDTLDWLDPSNGTRHERI